MNETYLEERPDGVLVEYRRVVNPTVLRIEGRVLRRDGRPYDGRWYPITDADLLRLGRYTDILDLLDPR